MSRPKNTKSGFTLAEMIVSVGLFAIVVTISTGALLQVLATNQRAQAIQTVMNNLDFALQQMARDIRVGSDYFCGVSTAPTAYSDCPPGSPSSSFSFTSSTNKRIVYELDTEETTEYFNRIIRSVNLDPYYPITSPDIEINKLSFYVSGSNPADNLQPKVLIVLSGYVRIKTTQTNFNLQTTVSQRLLDRS